VEQTNPTPGKYWLTPDGRMWNIGSDIHEIFATKYLGGLKSAFSNGCVRVSFDMGRLGLQAQDYYAFNLSKLSKMAWDKSVLVFVTADADDSHSSQFGAKSFRESGTELYTFIGQSWGLEPRGSLHVFADRSKVIEEPLTVDHLTITFHENLFDYYLAVPNMEGWYVTEIGGMKVGFGSKYQLKKFLLKIKTEFFTDGNLPGSNVRVAPIPKIEEPLVRRMGSVPIKENNLPIEVKRRLERGSVTEDVWEISEGDENSRGQLEVKPTGPSL
jgi:hypothetical protein